MTAVPTRDRRHAVRRAPVADEPLARVRLRAGSQLSVIDLSDAGMLVEGTTRLLPGTHVDVHVVTAEGRTLVRSRVVRACVSCLEAEMIRYRGALAFDRRVSTGIAGYSIPAILRDGTATQGSGYPDREPREMAAVAEPAMTEQL